MHLPRISELDYAPITGTGAADLAIGVAAADIQGTVKRDNDTPVVVKGPRGDQPDEDPLDELKPELLMPMGGHFYAFNSPASVATAGLVALILDYNSDLADFNNKAAGSVKDLLIRSAESKGTADTLVAYPEDSPTWDDRWGFGEIDAYEAFSNLSDGRQGGTTDLTFLGFDGSSHPSTPWYFSSAIGTQSERMNESIVSSVPDVIFTQLINKGTQDAENVKVSFGFYPITAGIPTFYIIGSKIVDVPAGETVPVEIDWVPPDLGNGEEHGCISVTIDYGYDTDFSNRSNFAQRNVQVKRTSSPAVFDFRVENPLPTKATIQLKVTNNNPGWDLDLSEVSFVMETTECAKKIKATATPDSSVADGAEAVFFVGAIVRPWGSEELIEVGGVALKAIHEIPFLPPINPPIVPPVVDPGNILRPDLGNLLR